MATTSERRRAYSGPVIFSHGFRPFFLLAGVWAALSMLIWVVFLATDQSIPSRLAGVDWHMHEMLFGYASAVVAGFLMTAVPNWTGRMPVIGWPVAALAAFWLAGRIALLFSSWLPPLVAPLVDIGFLLLFGTVIAREIMAGKNWRNMKVLVLVLLLAIANTIFHIEAAGGSAQGGYGIRMGVGVIIFLITLIGGRVIPSFTRNWLARRDAERLPAPASRFDALAIGSGGLALMIWIAMPEFAPARALFLIAAVLHAIRLARWAGLHTLAEPLVTILHVAYAFVPIGFVTLATGISSQIPHAWLAGAVGTMTLAMMTRAALGHSGRKLTATRPIMAIYVAILAAVFLRIAAEFLPGNATLLYLSATAWIAGFAGYVIVYFPIFTQGRK